MLQRAGIGQIQHVHGIYTKGVMNNGSHLLDLLRCFWGDPRDLDILGVLDPGAADPTLSFRLAFSQDITVWVAGVAANEYNVFELDVLGSTGRVVFRDLGHLVETYTREDTLNRHGFSQLSPRARIRPTGLREATRYAIDDLIDSIEKVRSPRCTPEDGRAALALSLRLAEAAKASGADQRTEGGRLQHV